MIQSKCRSRRPFIRLKSAMKYKTASTSSTVSKKKALQRLKITKKASTSRWQLKIWRMMLSIQKRFNKFEASFFLSLKNCAESSQRGSRSLLCVTTWCSTRGLRPTLRRTITRKRQALKFTSVSAMWQAKLRTRTLWNWLCETRARLCTRVKKSIKRTTSGASLSAGTSRL